MLLGLFEKQSIAMSKMCDILLKLLKYIERRPTYS